MVFVQVLMKPRMKQDMRRAKDSKRIYVKKLLSIYNIVLLKESKL